MARLIYEFFRPRMSMSVIFPIGVVAQDEEKAVYRSLPLELPQDVDANADFYNLPGRQALMNDDLLPHMEATDSRTGTRMPIEPSDPRLLGELQRRGTHHFLYSPVEEQPGTAAEVADREAARLADGDARRELALRLGDYVTRAVVEAYA
jgi:hypothetical protein